MRITVAATNLTFATLLAFMPVSVGQLEKAVPFFQVSAFTLMAVNHGIQVARHLKEPDA
jgi:hypothetical protein